MSSSEITWSDEARDDSAVELHVTVWTMVQFLFGSRCATLTLAARPDTLWLGLIFVLSAGFAREYDRADLLHEPWQLFLPCLVALAGSLGIFPLIEVVGWRRGVRGGRYWSRYRTLLGLFWMTAPLGWIYAIPVERFLMPDDANGANLWFLGIVSMWRVLLITRVLSILYVPHVDDVIFTGIFFVVMLFADTMAVSLSGPFSFPLMGGTIGGSQQHAAEHILLGIKFGLTIIGILSWPVWLIGTLVVMFWVGPHWAWTVETAPSPPPLSRQMKILSAASLLIWILVLPWTQPEQQRRYATVRSHQNGDVDPTSGGDNTRRY